MHQLTLPLETSSESDEVDVFQVCPECGHSMPPQIVICWWCGYCLDKWIRELAEAVA